ncbi:hypothetical protein DFJ73DRAFT_799736 [Zopfochytrium polystomum]|nr:hypothetical protein DFJ73DRAFT_799736 [Zopfochytrium polystomum]
MTVPAAAIDGNVHAAAELIAKAKSIHASIFSTNRAHKLAILDALYSPSASFDDPLVAARGVREVEAQYLFLTLFPDIAVRSLVVAAGSGGGGGGGFQSDAAAALIKSAAAATDVVVIDAVVAFTVVPPRLWAVELRVLSRFEFSPVDGRLVRHEDVWSLRDLLAGLWLVGWVYEAWRRAVGWFTAAILLVLLGGGASGNNNRHSAAAAAAGIGGGIGIGIGDGYNSSDGRRNGRTVFGDRLGRGGGGDKERGRPASTSAGGGVKSFGNGPRRSGSR